MAVAAIVVVAVIAALAVVDDDDATAPADTTARDEGIPAGTTPAGGTTSVDDVPPTESTGDSETASTVVAGTAATTTTPDGLLPPGPNEPNCTFLGFDGFDDMQVELSFVNPLGPVGSLELDYALSNVDGVRFHAATVPIGLPRAEERFRIAHDTVEPLPVDVSESSITCLVLDITEGPASPDVRPPRPGDGCAVTGIDRFGDIQIELTATSPFDQESELLLTYALTTTDGVRFDTDVSIVDTAADETIRLQVDTVTAPPPWASDVGCRLLGIESLDL